MRRDINIRKKKKVLADKLNKKVLKIIFSLILLLIICFTIYFSFFKNTFLKNNFENDIIDFSNLNDEIPFSVNKILLFSSATAESNTINQQLTLDISQYCDIGIYLNKTHNEDVLISSLYIDNIIISSPEIGTPFLYQKKLADIGKCTFNEESIVDQTISFNVVDSSKNIDSDNHEVDSNLSTPISLGFYNKNIKTDFFPNTSEILYNGTLLKDAMIPITSINSTISFRINIITASNEHYICNINFSIPFENGNESIYDTGYITKEIENNEINKFIRLK